MEVVIDRHAEQRTNSCGCLALNGFTNVLSNSLGNWRLHHSEVIALNGDHLALLDIEESVPAVGAEISSVLQEPFHALWVVSLWWW